ncbi:hypothetical protein PFISCL1PPCAC_13341, partial [Pristionchus fissidentatus]
MSSGVAPLPPLPPVAGSVQPMTPPPPLRDLSTTPAFQAYMQLQQQQQMQATSAAAAGRPQQLLLPPSLQNHPVMMQQLQQNQFRHPPATPGNHGGYFVIYGYSPARIDPATGMYASCLTGPLPNGAQMMYVPPLMPLPYDGRLLAAVPPPTPTNPTVSNLMTSSTYAAACSTSSNPIPPTMQQATPNPLAQFANPASPAVGPPMYTDMAARVLMMQQQRPLQHLQQPLLQHQPIQPQLLLKVEKFELDERGGGSSEDGDDLTFIPVDSEESSRASTTVDVMDHQQQVQQRGRDATAIPSSSSLQDQHCLVSSSSDKRPTSTAPFATPAVRMGEGVGEAQDEALSVMIKGRAVTIKREPAEMESEEPVVEFKPLMVKTELATTSSTTTAPVLPSAQRGRKRISKKPDVPMPTPSPRKLRVTKKRVAMKRAAEGHDEREKVKKLKEDIMKFYVQNVVMACRNDREEMLRRNDMVVGVISRCLAGHTKKPAAAAAERKKRAAAAAAKKKPAAAAAGKKMAAAAKKQPAAAAVVKKKRAAAVTAKKPAATAGRKKRVAAGDKKPAAAVAAKGKKDVAAPVEESKAAAAADKKKPVAVAAASEKTPAAPAAEDKKSAASEKTPAAPAAEDKKSAAREKTPAAPAA